MAPRQVQISGAIFERHELSDSYLGRLDGEDIGFTTTQVDLLVRAGVAEYVEPRRKGYHLDPEVVRRLQQAHQRWHECGSYADEETLRTNLTDIVDELLEELKANADVPDVSLFMDLDGAKTLVSILCFAQRRVEMSPTQHAFITHALNALYKQTAP